MQKEVIIVTALAITNHEWVIGKNSKVLFRVREDRERFHELTKGKVVIYGINTLKTLPNGKPLPERTNIILTHDRGIRIPGAITVGTINELHFVLKNYSTDDVYLIGGEKTFAELIDECKSAILTVVENKTEGNPEQYEYFPNLDQKANWSLGRKSSTHYCEGYCWTRVTYTNLLFRKYESKGKV